MAEDLPTIRSLTELAELVDHHDDLYVRWSRGPEADRSGTSKDELTGVELPGLSASALSVEPWWEGRDQELWVARRLYDYRHLEYRRRHARPWVFIGEECGRGPDNEPLAICRQPVAWIARNVVEEATTMVESTGGDGWGPIDRESARD